MSSRPQGAAAPSDGARGVGAPHSLSLLTTPDGWDDPGLRRRWEELSASSDNVNSLYASPVWFDLLRRGPDGGRLALAVAYDGDGAVAGLAPVLFKGHPFQYYVGRHPVYTSELKAAHVLGSTPMLPEAAASYEQLVGALLKSGADCVYMDTVPVESFCWRQAQELGRKDFLVYAPGGPRAWHLLRLPGDPEAYLSGMSSKTRYTLRKKAKQLAERGGGQLEMVRVESEEQVASFLADAVSVSRKTWQHSNLGKRIGDSEEERAWYAGLARAGVLRGYILRCGERPCAFVVGYQHNGVFHDVELGYDPDFKENSPGTVLLHMLIQDLCSHRPAALLNFGLGDADYKGRFGNVRTEDVSVLVMRKSLLNRLRVGSHASFRTLVRSARDVVRRVQSARSSRKG
jgi:CelD/BcsL family acetyltransferase involved in cellulose biosynthesis